MKTDIHKLVSRLSEASSNEAFQTLMELVETADKEIVFEILGEADKIAHDPSLQSQAERGDADSMMTIMNVNRLRVHISQVRKDVEVEGLSADGIAAERSYAVRETREITGPPAHPDVSSRRATESPFVKWIRNPSGENNPFAFFSCFFAVITTAPWLFLKKVSPVFFDVLQYPSTAWLIVYGLLIIGSIIALVFGVLGYFSRARFWSLVGLSLTVILDLVIVL